MKVLLSATTQHARANEFYRGVTHVLSDSDRVVLACGTFRKATLRKRSVWCGVVHIVFWVGFNLCKNYIVKQYVRKISTLG